jgi:hypothetical protein
MLTSPVPGADGMYEAGAVKLPEMLSSGAEQLAVEQFGSAPGLFSAAGSRVGQ